MPTLAVPQAHPLAGFPNRESTNTPDELVQSGGIRSARGMVLGIVLGAGLWLVILVLFGVIKL